ncbi:hypothetical protein ANANG_G00160840 [Anguilla anguilla]|uniref:Uncharacterized protein n=1 Tax=Anguilla anguilla TaxID=7936 RepID=A0A9D3RV51_ANGAN|nr:hypothetical protein ANANG_G00160840 [Anguilla anguilla]
MSQLLLESTPAGNLQLSAAILFSGSSFIQTHKVLNTMRVKTISSATFRVHAHTYLQPTIFYKWKTDQEELLQSLRQKGRLSRAFSEVWMLPHDDSNVIVDIQMVQKYVREEKPAVIHYYDVWHVAKSVSRKLEDIAKQCKKVKKWQCSIRNHMYWSATTAASGKETVAKWSSLINHMHNIHTHEDHLFPKCVHPDLSETHGNKWFQPGNATVYKVEKALLNKRILKDVEKLRPQHQTSALEALHSVILRLSRRTDDTAIP